jgi:hypothetical protein
MKEYVLSKTLKELRNSVDFGDTNFNAKSIREIIQIDMA